MNITALAQAFAAGETTATATIEACLAKIAARNPALNAIAHLDEAVARAAAARADARHREGNPLTPLDGAPIVIKANVAVAGLPWTAALGPFAQRVAAQDSEIVKRLRNAGAIIVGIANMHEGALGATTTSPLYGPCQHPAREGYTPGGSSGGSAAAVAAGFCAGAIGSDTMGSVRLPSSYCGIVGMKPSFGRIPRAGVELLSFSLDHAGVHAMDVAGVGALLDVVAEVGRTEEGDLLAPLLSHGVSQKISRRPLRVGVLGHNVDVQQEIATRFDAAVAAIANAGLHIEPAPLSLVLGKLRREALLVTEAECAALFAEAGVAPDDASLSETFRTLVAYGTAQPGVRLAAAYAAMRGARRAAKQLFNTCDVVICPTTPHVAFPHGQPAPATQADLTVLANVAGLPAISLPMGEGADGLPCGLQIMAAHGEDALCLDAAAQIEALL